MPGLSSRFTSRHSSSRCGFSGGAVPAGQRAARARGGATAGSAGGRRTASTARASCSASAQRPCSSRSRARTPSCHARADRGVALLADAQRVGDRLLRLGEAPLLDVEVAEVAHRCRRQVVEPVPQADVGGREQVGPRRAGRRRAGARPRPRWTRCCAARRRRPARRRSAPPGRPTVAPPAVSPRWAARKACLARAKPSARAVVGRRRGSRWRPASCRSASGAVGRVPREAGDRGVPGADRDDVPQSRAQLERPLPRRDGVAAAGR